MPAPTAHVTERPQRADARRNRERIVVAAKREFEDTGLEAHMEAVARRAGVGVGTLYRHFPTKEALMGEIVSEKFRVLRDNARRAVEGDAEPWDAFSGTLRQNAEAMSRDAAVQHVIMHAQSEAVWEPSERIRDELLTATGTLIERGQDAGVIRPDLTADDVRLMMSGLCGTMARATPAGSTDWRRHLELILDATRPR